MAGAALGNIGSGSAIESSGKLAGCSGAGSSIALSKSAVHWYTGVNVRLVVESGV